MQISLIIPALNEAECLPQLLAEIPPDLIDQTIVVDNGSTDQTAEVALAAGAVVIAEPRRGYGYACSAGAAAAKGDVLAFMDGDGSFDPGELPVLLAPLIQDGADLVLGSRLGRRSSVMPSHQRAGNFIFAWLLRQRFGLALADLGPYRIIRRELLENLDMQERTFGWPLEMIIKTARLQRKIIEVPITNRPRIAGESKVGGTWQGSILTAYRFSLVTLRYAY